MIRAFIFDLDGTLVDTEILWVKGVEEFLNGRNHPLTHAEALQIVYGKAWSDVRNDILKRYPYVEKEERSLAESIRGYVNRLKESEDIIIESSVNLLKELAHNYPVSIVSGSARVDVEDSIALMGIEDYIEFSLASEDYTLGKPNPSCYLKAAEMLAIPPEACLVFEDSAAGIEAAKRAGMYCIALAREVRPKQDTSSADQVFSDLSQFRLENWTD